MAIRVILSALIFAFKIPLSLTFFTLKIRIKLFLTRRSWIRKVKRTLKKHNLPSDLRKELLEIYRIRLNENLSKLTSMLKPTSLLRGLSLTGLQGHGLTHLRYKRSHKRSSLHDLS